MPLDQAPRTIPSQDTASIITGHGAKVAKITIELSDLIARETGFLKDRKPRQAQELHGEKSRLIAEYKDALGKLRVNETQLGAEDSRQRKYLRQLTDQLRDVMRDHARIVLRLKSVTEGLIRSVGDEISKKNSPVLGYGRNAAVSRPRTNRPTSLSLNQVI